MPTPTLISVTFDKATWDVEHALCWLYNRKLSTEYRTETALTLTYTQRPHLTSPSSTNITPEQGITLTFVS